MSQNNRKEKKVKSFTTGEGKITIETIREVVTEVFKTHEENTKYTELFKNHEENIKTIIAANTKIMIDRIDKLTVTINDLQQSLEFTENVLKEKIIDVEQKFSSKQRQMEEQVRFTQENYVPKKVHDQARNKLIDLEDRSRWENLRIDGIPESIRETWEDCERKVKDIIKNKLGIDNIIIERAHRIATRDKTQERQNPKTIIFKLSSYKDKIKILKNVKKLKNTGIYINEDFCRETMEKRKELWKEVKRLREEGKYAVIQYNKVVSHDFKR